MSTVTSVLNEIYVLKCDGCCNHISNMLIQYGGTTTTTQINRSSAVIVVEAGFCTGSLQQELLQMPK